MKIFCKKLLSAIIVCVMIATTFSISCVTSSAKETVYGSYEKLWNYIDVLGYVDDNGDKYLKYDISDENMEQFVYLTDSTEYDCIEMYADGSNYDYEYWVYLYVGKNDTKYEVYISDGTDYETYNGFGQIIPEKYIDNSVHKEIEVHDYPYYYSEEEVRELLSLTCDLGLAEIEYALLAYCGLSLSNFGFTYYNENKANIDSTDVNGLVYDGEIWWFYQDNEIDFDFDGLAYNAFGRYYVNCGVIDYDFTGWIEVDNEVERWFVYEGMVDYDFVGLFKIDDEWLYISDGYVNYDYTGMAKNQWGWWYVKNGTIDFSYTGMAKNQYGWWYMKNGKLDKTYTGMAKNQYGWWYMKNGKLDKTYTGMAKNQYGWWYIQNGTINFKYNGTASNQYGTWKVVNGKVTTKA